MMGNEKKPSIYIYYNTDLSHLKDIEEIFFGIEEEGIPYDTAFKEEKDVIHLAYEASKDSPLGVGIGVDHNRIVIHYEKLKKDQPLYTMEKNCDDYLMRTLGANAARLIKGIPFKNLEANIKEDDATLEDVENQIKMIVKKVIARMNLG